MSDLVGRAKGYMVNGPEHKEVNVKSGRLRLTRKRGEGVLVECNGEELHVVVHSIRNGQVALVFQAPPSFGIWRDEVVARRKQLIAEVLGTAGQP